jgi:hypothetical protein
MKKRTVVAITIAAAIAVLFTSCTAYSKVQEHKVHEVVDKFAVDPSWSSHRERVDAHHYFCVDARCPSVFHEWELPAGETFTAADVADIVEASGWDFAVTGNCPTAESVGDRCEARGRSGDAFVEVSVTRDDMGANGVYPGLGGTYIQLDVQAYAPGMDATAAPADPAATADSFAAAGDWVSEADEHVDRSSATRNWALPNGLTTHELEVVLHDSDWQFPISSDCPVSTERAGERLLQCAHGFVDSAYVEVEYFERDDASRHLRVIASMAFSAY